MNINYIWIGSNPANFCSVVAGSIEIAKPINSPYYAHFWCLNEHTDQFKLYFERNNINNISVHSIEKYISQVKNSLWMYQYEQKWAIDSVEIFINQIANKIKQSKCNTRDIVNAKNLTALFLLYYKGGYTVDTSVYPTNIKIKKEINLPEKPILAINSVEKNPSKYGHNIPIENSNITDFVNLFGECGSSFSNLECSYMYSPKHHGTSWSSLEYFLRYLPIIYGNINSPCQNDMEVSYQYLNSIHNASAV